MIPSLAVDPKNDLPDIKGFSERNLGRMIQFYREYATLFLIWPRPVAKLEETQKRPRDVENGIVKIWEPVRDIVQE